MVNVEPLGEKRDKQIGEKRGDVGIKAPCDMPCPTEGQYDCTHCSEYRMQYPPYSSDLNVTMRLVGELGDFDIRLVKMDKERYGCILFYAYDTDGNCLSKTGEGATPALAMIDAITKAYLEVNGG